MELFNIFKADQDGVRRSHIKNLISIAMVDGHLDPEEWELLSSIARVLGMSPEEISTIKNNPDSVQFVPPRKYEEKVEQIHDLVAVMTIDGQINAKELDLCKKISLKLDILPQMVDQILEDVFPADQKS